MGTTSIIMAAGEGTRMKSSKAKVTHEVLGRPLVRWVVEAARAAGADSVITVVGFGRDQVQPLVEDDTTVVIQEEQRGTADAVASCRQALEGFSGSLLVLNGDCPLVTSDSLAALVAAREEIDAGAAIMTMQLDDPTGYGRIVRDDSGMVEAIIEQKECTEDQARIQECNAGFYCFDAQMLFEALNQVSNDNAKGEFYLTDVIHIARQANRAVVGWMADDAQECLGVNTRVQLAEATRAMQQRINTAHMLAGVTMTDPTSVWIGPDVTLDADTELLPQTMLWGTTHIGAGSVVGPNTRLTDTQVGRDCVIDETVALQAIIEDGCTCGPRAYLRPEAHLMPGAKAGTHVEIKKSTIGAGSKVPHLSYIGDTTMGAGVNVGAGSITCNYDGAKKWPTVIGDNTFVGSDTMMVAPVTIGSNVLVGAGSVITDDIPDGALALGRAHQVVKEGWKQHHDQQS